MKLRIRYIYVPLIILAIGQVALFCVSSWAKKPVESAKPLRPHREQVESPSIAVTVTVVDKNDPPLLPDRFALSQNYPNPFNAHTMIRYDVSRPGLVRLAIYNLLGQEVARLVDRRQLAGTYTIAWDASNLPSGLYFCRMEVAGFSQTRKMLLVK